jgi:hypothetical protein
VTGTVTGATPTMLTVTLTSPPTALGALSATVFVDGGESNTAQVATVANGNWVVTDPNGAAGSGSLTDVTLPYAVSHALSGDLITFSSGMNGGTINLSSPLTVTTNVTIIGPGPLNGPTGLALDGGDTVQGFIIGTAIGSGVTASISGLTLEHFHDSNYVPGNNYGNGGAVTNYGTLTLTNCILTENSSAYGGAGVLSSNTLILNDDTFTLNTVAVSGGALNVYHAGTAAVTNCTFFDNTSGVYGGAIISIGVVGVTMTNTTIAGNTASYYGGGIVNGSTGAFSMDNCIVAGNTAPTGPDTNCITNDVYPFSAVNYCLIGDTADYATNGGANNLLDTGAGLANSLADNGGATPTLALLSGSAAIGAGDPGQAGTTSQNAVVRPSAPDIGAYQHIVAAPPSITSVVINQDISALYNAAGQPFAGAQRSMVDDIVYTFSEPVNILDPGTDPNVFTVAVAAGWTGTVPTLDWMAVPGSGDTQWAVTFSGNGVSGGSIANGAYTITITDPDSITAESDGQALSLAPNGIGAATQYFYRLYGDINGDRFVNAADNVKFKNALTTYNAAFDYTNDGFVNASDNVRFKADLTLNFSGFTPTI